MPRGNAQRPQSPECQGQTVRVQCKVAFHAKDPAYYVSIPYIKPALTAYVEKELVDVGKRDEFRGYYDGFVRAYVLEDRGSNVLVHVPGETMQRGPNVLIPRTKIAFTPTAGRAPAR